MARFDTDLASLGRRIGRYEVLGEIASGGMATVYLARSLGAKGFSRLVAIKRLHPHLEAEDEFVHMFLDEARLAARIRHPNVVATLDVEDSEGLYIVMEYIEGVTLLNLWRAAQKSNERIPVPVVARVVLDTLGGLHAAHELLDDQGQFLGLVHRDVSPQNILVGTDGSSRLTDFGIAKATSRLTMTRDGQLKGKISYMAPEQTRRVEIDRRVDLFAMGVCTWELLAGKRLFQGESDVEVLNQLLFEPIPRLRDHAPSIPAALEQAVMKALERDPAERYGSASEFGDAIETAMRVLGGPANHRAVASFVQKVAGERIARERGRIASGASPTELSTGSWKAVDTPPVTPSRVRSTVDPPVPARSRPPPTPGTPLSQGRYAVPAEGSHPRLKSPEAPAERRVRAPTLAGARVAPPRPSPSIPPRPSVPPRPAPPVRSRVGTMMGTGARAPSLAVSPSDFDPSLPTTEESRLAIDPEPDFEAPAPGEATLVEASPEAFIARQLDLERRMAAARSQPIEIEPEPTEALNRRAPPAPDELPTDPPAREASPSFASSSSPSFAPLPASAIPPPPAVPTFDASPAGPSVPWSLGASPPPQASWQVQGGAPLVEPADPPKSGRGRVALIAIAVLALGASAAVGASMLLRQRGASVSAPSVAAPVVPPPVVPAAQPTAPVAALVDAAAPQAAAQDASTALAAPPPESPAPDSPTPEVAVAPGPPEAPATPPSPEAPAPEATPTPPSGATTPEADEARDDERRPRSRSRSGRRHRARDPDDLEMSPLVQQLPAAGSRPPERVPTPAAPPPRPAPREVDPDGPDLANPYRN